MASIYEDPTRLEILLLVLKYNHKHHKVDNIHVSNASKDSDLVILDQMVKDEQNASESAKQLKESLKELQYLRRVQLKKGPPSNRGDWVDVRAAGRKLVDAAERRIAKHDAKTAAAEAEERQKVKAALLKAVMKPVLPSPPPESEMKICNPQRPLSPQRVPKIEEGLSKRVMKPLLPSPPKAEAKNRRPQRPWSLQAIPPYKTQPRPSSPPKREVKLPSIHVKSQEKRPQSPDARERQRKLIIQQKEIEAHLQAKKLHSEVRKYGNEA